MTDHVRDAWIRMIVEMSPTIAVTLAAGHSCSAETFNKAAKTFCCRLERRANGARWAGKPSALRMSAIGFHEHPHSNLHMHIAMSAAERIEDRVISIGNAQWREVRPSGDFYCRPIVNVEAYARYITKDVWNADPDHGVFVYAPRNCSYLKRC